MVMLGTGKNPLSISTGQLIGEELSVLGSLTGTPHENEKTLRFSVLTGVRPRVETLPLERAFEAYQRMKSGAATFRMVLTMPVRQ
jgi:alcohol dehydrogenase